MRGLLEVPEVSSSESAARLAATRAVLARRDLDGYRVWKRMLRAVGELRRKAPKSGEAIH
jgi:hypothetical protein